jgi:hypothetical protein
MNEELMDLLHVHWLLAPVDQNGARAARVRGKVERQEGQKRQIAQQKKWKKPHR